jgi:hypothetical protein
MASGCLPVLLLFLLGGVPTGVKRRSSSVALRGSIT